MKYKTEKTFVLRNMVVKYSDWIKVFYGFILTLPFIILFICLGTIVCRYKSKIIEDPKKINLKKKDRDVEAEQFF